MSKNGGVFARPAPKHPDQTLHITKWYGERNPPDNFAG